MPTIKMKFVFIPLSFMLLLNVHAQDALKNRFVELGLSANYSTSYSQVTNKMGGGLGLYFNTQKQKTQCAVWGRLPNNTDGNGLCFSELPNKIS